MGAKARNRCPLCGRAFGWPRRPRRCPECLALIRPSVERRRAVDALVLLALVVSLATALASLFSGV